jgi:protease-4
MENTQPASNVPTTVKKRRFPKFLTSAWFIILTTIILLAIWIIISIQSVTNEFLGMSGGNSAESGDLIYEYYKGDKESEIKVARLELNGPISNSLNEGSPLSLVAPQIIYGKEIASNLDKLSQNKDIKAVLIDLTTPGGEIGASSNIADAIEAYQKKTNQKVYVFVNELSASGGAWASATASTVIASPTAIVGSIGVAGGYAPKFTNISSYSEGLLGASVNANINFTPIYRGKCKQPDNQLNISDEYIKDCINPDVDALYSAFVNHISKYNQLSPETIRNEMGARVFLGNSNEATKYGLVDKVGNEEFAINLINQELNQGNPVQIMNINEYTGGLFEELFGPIFYKDKAKVSLSHTSFCQSNTPLLLYGDITQIRTGICKE